jgi:predicted nucleotidyltransferase
MTIDNIKQELQDITTAITNNVKPEAIYLFGSYAYGTPDKDSDIDIYVVVPDDVPDTCELVAKIHYDIKYRVRPLDILLGKHSNFNRKRNTHFFEKEIATKGVKLYGN